MAQLSKFQELRNRATSMFARGADGARSIPGSAAQLGFGAFSLYTEYMSTGKTYGTGAGLISGVLYTLPGLTVPLLAYDLAKGIGDAAYQSQKGRTRSSFSTASMNDPYGNNYTMRQRSQQNLSRGRASLGSEARLFHS